MSTTNRVLAAFALLASVSMVSRAAEPLPPRGPGQARRDAAQVQAEAAREGRQNDRLNNDPGLNNDQSPRRAAATGASDRVTELHRAHPHAAALCHDGFLTSTRDRGRACTRHGGIDVWLSR